MRGIEKLRHIAQQGPGEVIPYFQAGEAAEVLALLDAANHACRMVDKYLVRELPLRHPVAEAIRAWKRVAESKAEHELIPGDSGYICRCTLWHGAPFVVSKTDLANAFAAHVVEATK